MREGEHYVINGQKVFTSRALYSDLMLLLARTTPLDQVAKKTDGISVFLIDLREARGNGVEIRPIRALMNHNTTEVFIENLRVPASALVGQEGRGFRYILDGMNAERILVASECGRWALHDPARGGIRWRAGGVRPADRREPGVQFPIARAHVELEAADLMARKAAALFDAHQPCGAEANMAKHLAAEATWKAADTALQTFGGFGYASEYGIERKWRECRIYQTAPISTNLVLAYVGQHVLGLPRSY